MLDGIHEMVRQKAEEERKSLWKVVFRRNLMQEKEGKNQAGNAEGRQNIDAFLEELQREGIIIAESHNGD